MSQHEWENLTSDTEILTTVRGLKIEFEDIHQIQVGNFVKEYVCNRDDMVHLTNEVNKLLVSEVIVLSENEIGQYISPVFLRKKSDNTHRMILNLKSLNKDVTYKHFKMDTISSILNLIDKDCFMTKVDIKSAYYSVPIAIDHQKYLKFYFNNVLYKFIFLQKKMTK